LRRLETRKGGPSVPSLRQKRKRAQKTQISRTCGRGTDASFGIEEFVELDVEHGLLDTTCEHVPGEADYLLGPSKDVDDVVELRAQTLVSEHGELVEPWVVDKASITQPINRKLGMVRIRNDSNNHANLKESKR
jgi:hypothetical protein